MCATGECHDCSILADLDDVDTCIECGGHGEMVEHRGERMHAECVGAFEALVENRHPCVVRGCRNAGQFQGRCYFHVEDRR